MAALSLLEGGGAHGAQDETGADSAKDDLTATRSTRPGADPAEAERAASIGAELLGNACQAVTGGQRRVAEALGVSPQLLSRMCDSRDPKTFALGKLVLLIEREPEVAEALLMGLRALVTRRRLAGGRSLESLALALTAATGEVATEAIADLADGEIDEGEEQRLEAKAAKAEREARAIREYVAANRAARLARKGTKG